MFKFVLSPMGKQVYRGGNIPVMNKPLKKVFKTEKEAENWFIQNLGSGSLSLFYLRKI